MNNPADKKGIVEVREKIPINVLSQEQQFQVLMAQLQERYVAWHHIRARSTHFTLWIVGMAIVLSWKLIESPCPNVPQKITVTVMVILLSTVSIYFLSGLATGCKHTRRALIRIETALGAHEPNYYLHGEALLPNQYKNTKTRPSSHFLTLYALLTVTVGYLLFAIWMPLQNANLSHKNTPQFQSKSTTNPKGGNHD